MVNLKDLILLVPDLINLFLSGYICISIYAWLNSKKYEISIIILWSLFLSFIIQSLSKCTHGILFQSHSFSTPEKYIIYIILGAILGILITFMRQTKLVKFIVDKTNHKSINSDIFDDIIDYDKKTIMNIYLKNSDIFYMGTFRLREEKGLESWIVLTEYYELKKENQQLRNEYINIRQDAYIQGRAEEQQKAKQIIYKNYIPVQKIEKLIEELKQDDINMTRKYKEKKNTTGELLGIDKVRVRAYREKTREINEKLHKLLIETIETKGE